MRDREEERKNKTLPSIQYSVSAGNTSLHWNKVGSNFRFTRTLKSSSVRPALFIHDRPKPAMVPVQDTLRKILFNYCYKKNTKNILSISHTSSCQLAYCVCGYQDGTKVVVLFGLFFVQLFFEHMKHHVVLLFWSLFLMLLFCLCSQILLFNIQLGLAWVISLIILIHNLMCDVHKACHWVIVHMIIVKRQIIKLHMGHLKNIYF